MSQQPAKEPLQCDLVMKGGITSGIVYPSTVIVLKHHEYQFKHIGGTSVGAVAAAATAAAEVHPDLSLYPVPRSNNGVPKASDPNYQVPKGFQLLYERVSKWLPEH